MTEQELSRIILAIYDAASDPLQWPAFYQLYAQSVPVDFVGVQVHDLRRRCSQFISSHGQPSQFSESYREYYSRLNVWRDRGAHLLQPGRVVAADRHTPPDLLVKSEFYNDFLKPTGIRHSAVAVVSRQEDLVTGLSINRTTAHGGFDESSLRFTEALLPHLGRAASIQERLDLMAAEETVLDSLSYGVVFLSHRGRIVFANRVAETIFRAKDGMELRGSFIHASDVACDRRLQAAILAARSPGRHSCEPDALLVVRTSMKSGYHVTVYSIRARSTALRQGGVLVLIADPERECVLDGPVLMRLLGLTPAETRVAGLLTNGWSTARISGHLGIQENTVRAHLKSMFAKTGTRGQGELIKFLLTNFLLRAVVEKRRAENPPRAGINPVRGSPASGHDDLLT